MKESDAVLISTSNVERAQSRRGNQWSFWRLTSASGSVEWKLHRCEGHAAALLWLRTISCLSLDT